MSPTAYGAADARAVGEGEWCCFPSRPSTGHLGSRTAERAPCVDRRRKTKRLTKFHPGQNLSARNKADAPRVVVGVHKESHQAGTAGTQAQHPCQGQCPRPCRGPLPWGEGCHGDAWKITVGAPWRWHGDRDLGPASHHMQLTQPGCDRQQSRAWAKGKRLRRDEKLFRSMSGSAHQG